MDNGGPVRGNFRSDAARMLGYADDPIGAAPVAQGEFKLLRARRSGTAPSVVERDRVAPANRASTQHRGIDTDARHVLVRERHADPVLGRGAQDAKVSGQIS